MKIYLVRHGDSAAGAIDNERPLSQQGLDDVNRLAKFIAPLHIHVARILHSEKLRAQQTANILSKSISSEMAPQTRIELDPLYPISSIIDESYSWDGDTLLVGHMPFMGKLAAKLITGNENHDVVTFKTGTMVCLEKIEGNDWVINWMLTPKLI